ncbi:MAG TPA: phosphoribosylformylglycinamidine synthase subunit PurQ [Candidatus Limnocylindrales bacterium]|nr:phosphoribosylformylglycinamidine synthase subunit PurQ [Candidatus Limnocylindrales bacterium]
MKWGVVTFPGTCDDRDACYAVSLLGDQAVPLWHGDEDLRGADAVVLPGGFSYGDYLRCGAMARFSPVMRAVAAHARAGGPVLGICNGFQILCEAGLLPGALVRNRSLRFLCLPVHIRVENTETAFTGACLPGQLLEIPVKHGEGCFVAPPHELDRLEREGRVIFRYTADAPNGAMRDIAGVANDAGNVVGLMPHPEHAVDAVLGSTDGAYLFRSAALWLERAARGAAQESRA